MPDIKQALNPMSRLPELVETSFTRLVVAAALVLACSCSRSCSPNDAGSMPSTPELKAARTTSPLVIDGKLEEHAWLQTGKTSPFADPQEPGAVVAQTEARALWDDQSLTIAFYLADEDIVSSDFVGVELRPPGPDGKSVRLEISPAGTIRCQAPGISDCAGFPGVRAAVDNDGTLDNSKDFDEEWTVELVVPWGALGLAGPPKDLALRFFRRDQPKGMPLRMLEWGRGVDGSENLGRLVF